VRVTDTFRFLVEIQERYYAGMRRFFTEIGLQAPLTGSNHWTEDVVDLRQNADFAFVDRHDYWTHPEGSYNYEAGQTIDPKPMVREEDGGTLGRLARRRVAGRPYTVSEWHHCLPNPYRAEGPMLMAAYASLQGWHPMQYAYWATTDTAPAMINAFEGMFDPAHGNLLPAAALLFARGDVRESPDAYYERVTRDQVMDPHTRVATRARAALAVKYGLAFTDLPAVTSAASLPREVEQGGRTVTSATGELAWNAADGLVTIDTARTQAAIGFVGRRPVRTGAVTFEIATPFAVVVVSSLSQDPIDAAARVLVSTSADARWTGTEVSPDGRRVLTTGRFPFLMQPVEGRIAIKGASGTVYRLDTDGSRLGTIDTRMTADGLALPLDATNRAMHYEIVRR
jgi:hypothetical protein